MSWICNLSNETVKQLRRLPRDRQRLIYQAIEEMKEEPLKGDVRPIKSGKFQGSMRKRVGQYRIIFSIDQSKHLIEIPAILIRSENTYR
jgi:mRNA-degrading endonuclease RelE of RelBE toxin-antitoxin system